MPDLFKLSKRVLESQAWRLESHRQVGKVVGMILRERSASLNSTMNGRFSLGLIGAVLVWALLLTTGLRAVFQAMYESDGGDQSSRILHVIGSMVFTALWILVCWAFGWVGYRSHRRSILKGRIGAGILLGVFIASEVFYVAGRDWPPPAPIQVRAQLAGSIAAMTSDRMRPINAPGDEVVAPNALDAELLEFEQDAVRSRGAQRIVNGILIEMNNELNDRLHPFRDAVNSFVRAGGINMASLESRSAISQRITRINECLVAESRFRELVDESIQRLGARLDATPLSNQLKAEICEQFRDSFQYDLVIAIRATDREILRTQKEMLEFCERHWGHWHIDADRGDPIFDEQRMRELYSDRVYRLKALRERNAAFQDSFSFRKRQLDHR